VTIVLIKADKNKARQKRHRRVRNHISGTAARPRLNVFRSLANIYAQIIDDEKGMTLVAASTQDKEFKDYGGNVAAAKAIGTEIAKRALDKGISEVVFDRGGYVYHGRVAALAEAAREAGLKF
jgi:large subunit ribosomal protein L18